jgi:hypothetical protein
MDAHERAEKIRDLERQLAALAAPSAAPERQTLGINAAPTTGQAAGAGPDAGSEWAFGVGLARCLAPFTDPDIEREIARTILQERLPDRLAALGIAGAGNLLAALGLLCYTEYLGGMINGKGVVAAGRPGKNFATGFRRLGPSYEAFADRHDVYHVFRCGLVHEYATKRSCEIVMPRSDDEKGIGEHPRPERGFRFHFCVEAYYHDLAAAFERLRAAGRPG